MNKFIKIFAYSLSAIAMATMVSGCSLRSSSGNTAPKVFTIWSFEDQDVWKPVIQEAQKELGGYTIKYVKKNLDANYENDALNSILSGQGPDIWAMPNDWVYRHKDKLAPMPSNLSSALKLDDNFVPAIKQSCVFDNNIYALSPFVDTLMIYSNTKIIDEVLNEYTDSHRVSSSSSEDAKAAAKKDLDHVNNILGSAPTTWTDLAEAVKLITKKDGNNIVRSGLAMGTTNNLTSPTDVLYALMIQNGTAMTSDDLKLATFSLPGTSNTGQASTPGKNALDFFTSFSNPSSPNYTWNSSMPNDVDALAQGKVAMMIGYSSTANYLAQKYPTFKYTKAPLPQIGDNDTNVVDYGAFYAYATPKLSANSAVAWNIISKIAQNDYSFANTLKIPGSKKQSSFTPSLGSRSGDNNPGKTQNQTAKLWVKGRYPKETDNIFKAAIDNTDANPAASQTELDKSAVSVTNLLKKTDW